MGKPYFFTLRKYLMTGSLVFKSDDYNSSVLTAIPFLAGAVALAAAFIAAIVAATPPKYHLAFGPSMIY